MTNPFRFGEAVSGPCFANRKKEIADIEEHIRSGQNVFIYSYRRLGKTSLIMKILDRLSKRKEALTIYVDIQKATSHAQFVEVYSGAIARALITRKERIERIAEFFRRIVPSFEIDASGTCRVSFDFSKTRSSVTKSMEEVLEMPQELALCYGKRVVVVFDEFQEIDALNGKTLEKTIRSFIQHHSDVSYVFMGSKTHVIMDMFSNPERAFYRAAAVYPLLTIPGKEMEQFVVKRFRDSGKKISRKLASEIVRVADNIPYCVQLLAFNVWLSAGRNVTERKLAEAVDMVLHSQNELFFSMYDSASLHQRAVLCALSKTKEVFSGDSIARYNLGSSSSVQASLKSLVRNDRVHKEDEGYCIADPFFKMWLEANISA